MIDEACIKMGLIACSRPVGKLERSSSKMTLYLGGMVRLC
jgi:hypothetical protein